MIINLTSKQRRTAAFVAGICTSLVLAFVFAQIAQAQSATVTVELEKKFSGPVPSGYTPDLFSFQVTGGSVNEEVTLVDQNDGTADGTIELPIGTYTVTEMGPDDFVEGEWRPGWYGDSECAASDDFTTTLTISSSTLDKEIIRCQVDNQWRFGTLRVVKEFVGTSTAPENFEFTVTQSGVEKFNGAFESDGDNEIVVGEGDYVVEETVHDGYTVTYSGDCDENGEGTMNFEDSQTCTVTNTWIEPTYSQSSYYSQGSYGGGESFLVFGYVWHDENENDTWEQDEPNPEDNESDLDGWTVEITNGESTFSTTTDSTGYYFFYVPEGTWTINEVVQAGWTKTFPNVNGHVVVVDGGMTQGENSSFFAGLLGVLLPTAHAQAPVTFGPYNFGNVFPGNQYSQGSYGGGGYSQGSYGGGNGRKVELRDGGGNGDGDDTSGAPAPQVLGESTDIPLGAPGTGHGGASRSASDLQALAILSVRRGVKASHAA